MTQPNQARFGHILLAEGVLPRHMIAYLFCMIIGVSAQAYGNMGQPYLLQEHLGIAKDVQGMLTGRLTLLQELIILSTVGIFGAISDRVGRRAVFMLALVFFAAAMIAFPLAGSPLQLAFAKALFGLALASYVVSVTALNIDYPDNQSRGKLLGLVGIMGGIAVVAVVSAGIARLPAYFQANGLPPIEAGRYTYWTVAILAIVGVIVARLGMKNSKKSETEDRPPFRELIRQGINQAKINIRIRLCFVLAFVSRGDIVILTTFFILWLVQAGIEAGLSTAEASARAGILFALVQGIALLWAPVMGFIVDRLNRVLGIMIAMGLASIGYLSTLFVSDPMSAQIYIVCVLLGLAEMSLMIAVGALLGQEAREDIRGSVTGLYSVFGAIGIMVTSSIGGYLFDNWIPAGPFVFMGALNILMLGIAAFVWQTSESGQLRRLNKLQEA